MLEGGTTVVDGASIEQILAEELTTLKGTIVNNIRATGQWASGQTAASMQVVAQSTTGELRGRRAFGTLETGRKPGRVPRDMQSIIYRWMQAKGLHGKPIPYVTPGPHKYPNAQVRGDMSMAAAIAHTIATKGTRLHRVGGRDDVYSQAIPETVARINARLGGIFQAIIEEQLKDNRRQT